MRERSLPSLIPPCSKESTNSKVTQTGACHRRHYYYAGIIGRFSENNPIEQVQAHSCRRHPRRHGPSFTRRNLLKHLHRRHTCCPQWRLSRRRTSRPPSLIVTATCAFPRDGFLLPLPLLLSLSPTACPARILRLPPSIFSRQYLLRRSWRRATRSRLTPTTRLLSSLLLARKWAMAALFAPLKEGPCRASRHNSCQHSRYPRSTSSTDAIKMRSASGTLVMFRVLLLLLLPLIPCHNWTMSAAPDDDRAKSCCEVVASCSGSSNSKSIYVLSPAESN